MKLNPKFFSLGLLIGAGCVALIGAASLNKYVGQFYGDGSNLSNITASATVSSATMTNPVLKFQLDATFEDTIKKEGSHGMLLQYDHIDGSGATILFRTTDSSVHFPSSTFIFDGVSGPTALGLDSTGHPVGIEGATNSSWTANTVLKASTDKGAVSIANSAGLLSNDGSGPAYTLTPGVNDLYVTNNFYASTNPVTGANVDASLGEQITNCTANPTISGIANVKTGLGFRNVLYILANGADRTVTYSVANVKKIPTGTWVVTNGSFGTLVSGGVGGTITGAVFTPFGP
jgi:hypothetical protein